MREQAASREQPDRIRIERDLFRRLLELGARDSLEPFLKEALELIVDVTRAEQGYLELRDPRDGGPEDVWSLAHGCSDTDVRDIQSHVSRGIIAAALATGETVVTHSALLDDRFRARESVRRAAIQAVLCAPIGSDAAHGVVYLQGRREAGPFSEADRESAELFARHLAPLADRLLLRRRAEDATVGLRRRYRLDRVVGHSRPLAAALEQAMLAAPLEVTVLLTGASGTGKTEVAKVIHANSPRAEGPFVEINCASLPESLVESELFGARAGAHSEARRDIAGKVAAAEGGTLFLDEVSELPVDSQAKLLQLLQSRQYYALGASEPTTADVRIIAATNADLEERVRTRGFREDLFYRLNVLPVHLPGLAERREDVPDLAQSLGERSSRRNGLDVRPLSPAALRALAAAEWPGNVRQLENCIESAAIRAAGEGSAEIGLRHVFPERDGESESDEPLTYQEAIRGFQRELLEKTLRETEWNVSEAARRLDLARSHVYQLIASLGLRRSSDP